MVRYSILRRVNHGSLLTLLQSISLIGQYGFWVIEGSITILGAIIHGGSKLYKVYAPSNYSIPIMKHFRDSSGPNKQPAIIQFENLWTGVRELSLVSPFFENVANGHETPFTERSFQYVGLLNNLFVLGLMKGIDR